MVDRGGTRFEDVRRLLLLVMPGAASIVPNSSPEELHEEYELVISEIEELCSDSVSVDRDEVSVKEECRKLLEKKLKKLEDRKGHMPRLIRMYLEGVDHVVPTPALER